MAAEDQVVLKLAHPLTAEQATMVNAEPRQYGVGDELVVPVNTAMTVINAGYAQVDPSDQKAVAAVLAAHPAEDPGARPAGSGDATASTPGTGRDRAAGSTPPLDGPPPQLVPKPSPATP